MSAKAGRLIVVLVLVCFAINLVVLGYVGYSSYKGRVETVKNQRAGCDRGKLDRKDNADFQMAHSKYIFKVTGAASVKEDVKAAAREARKTFKRTSKSLTKRSKINCETAFPKASIIP